MRGCDGICNTVNQFGIRWTGFRQMVAVIGDSENDINAGRRAGTRTCGVTFGFRTAEQLRVSEPEVMIDRFDQLKELFC